MSERLSKIKAVIWFGDQAGLRSDYHVGTTWGLKGKTPVVKNTGARYRLNMISVVNRLGKMRFMIETGRMNAETLCQFLDRLMVGSQRPVFLILDGHPMHKSGRVSATVRSYQGRLRLFTLPPYSLELNPDQGVWREVKSHRVGRAGVFSLDDLKLKAVAALRHLAKRPDKIRALFHSATTSYAA
ncbi:transposase [candidate division TA06 bacterium]|uniref:Transposase n=1 Tax=candidate division TA06 bacterium TaxID=2250710 RepID=A0A933I7B0_UNCT6|nr:transposase [candidate division TA06 bacterium]